MSLYHIDSNINIAFCSSGKPKFVRLGDVNLYNDTDDAQPQNFTIVQIVLHPEYSFRYVYNDIALLKLDRPVVINKYVRPACLYPNVTVSEDVIPTAIGWGATSYLGDASDDLMKIYIYISPKENCTKPYMKSVRVLPNGIMFDRQVCAGYNYWEYAPMDTCHVSRVLVFPSLPRVIKCIISLLVSRYKLPDFLTLIELLL